MPCSTMSSLRRTPLTPLAYSSFWKRAISLELMSMNRSPSSRPPSKPGVPAVSTSSTRSAVPGAQVSELAAQCTERIRPKASVKGTQCSLSGLENQCNQLLAAGKSPAYVCRYCLLCVAETAYRMVVAALEDHPGLPVVFAGGVMSSDIIQKELSVRLPGAHFVPGRFSSDNAIGVALLAAREVAHD